MLAVAGAAPINAATPTRTPTRTPTVTPTPTPTPTFAFGRRSAYPVDGVSGLAVGDFDGDGRPDIAAIGFGSNAVSAVIIWYSQPDGTFRPQLDAIPVTDLLDGIAAGKLVNLISADKLDDLALLVQDFNGDDTLQVYTNLGGTGQHTSFRAPSAALAVGGGPAGIAVLDLIGDGSDNALAVPNSDDSPGTVSIFTRTGPVGGNFAALPGSPLMTGRDLVSGLPIPMAVAAGLLDNDALPDLAVALNQDFGVAVHLNTGAQGSPMFGPPAVYDPDPGTSGDIGPTGVVIGDFNKDGHPDIALSDESAPGTNPVSGSVTIHINNGDGTFANAVAYPVGNSSVDGLATADFNGDGKLDIITRNGDDTLSVLYGNGDGTFQVAPNLASIPTGQGLIGLAIADFNQDGKLDVAVAEANDNTISVFLGGGVIPPPTPSLTPTITPTSTPTPTITLTPSVTQTPTITRTPAATATPSRTATGAATPTITKTPTAAPTATGTLPSPSPSPTRPSGVPGDANCDHAVTPADLDALVVRLFNPNFHSECNGADANRDHDVTAADFPAIVQFIVP